MASPIDDYLAVRRLDPRHAARIRQAAGIPQSVMAAQVGVHRVTVARWETGAARPQGDHGRRWLDALARLAADAEEASRAPA